MQPPTSTGSPIAPGFVSSRPDPDPARPDRLGHRQHDHVAGLDAVHDGVNHQVVVLPAAHGSRGPGGARAGHDLDECLVDEPLRPAAS